MLLGIGFAFSLKIVGDKVEYVISLRLKSCCESGFLLIYSLHFTCSLLIVWNISLNFCSSAPYITSFCAKSLLLSQNLPKYICYARTYFCNLPTKVNLFLLSFPPLLLLLFQLPCLDLQMLTHYGCALSLLSQIRDTA